MKSDHTLEVIAKHFCQQTGRPVGSINLHRLGQEGADGAELPLSAQFGELGLAAQDVLIARAKEGAAGAAAPASGASGGPSPAKRARVETAAAAGAGGSPTPELRQGGAAPAAAAAAAAPVGSGIEKLASEHARLLAAKTSLAQELRQLEESRSALRARAQAAAAARCDAAEELGKVRLAFLLLALCCPFAGHSDLLARAAALGSLAFCVKGEPCKCGLQHEWVSVFSRVLSCA